MATIEKLVQVVIDGDMDNAEGVAEAVLVNGADPEEVINCLTEAMRVVGERFNTFEIFLPEMIMSSEAMMKAVKSLAPKLAALGKMDKKAKVLMGSPAGDMHEIGKDIVITVLNANGFDVVNLGANVDSLEFVNKARDLNADVIGISALMTTTMPNAKEIIELLTEKGLRKKVKVIVGGAPTTPEWAKAIGADGWAENASQAVDLIDRLLA